MLVLVVLAGPGGVLAADIRDTKHNLVGRDEEGGATKVTTKEVCVFCHTPTIAENAQRLGVNLDAQPALHSGPLWQASLKKAHEFTLFDDIGRMGLEGIAVIGSVSVACLSCHDATQAFSVGTEGMVGGLEHPFGVPYRGVELSPEVRKRLLADAEEKGVALRSGKRLLASVDFQQVRKGLVNNRTVWWASSDLTRTSRSKSDLPLYPRRASIEDEDEAVIPFVECTTCHDPHTTNQVFLRITNSGGRICLTCHTK